jgi:hypothetical protein
MSYGELKIDTITFTAGGVDASVSVSGLVQNPTFTGNITTTGTISGDVVRGNTVSGATVTGDAGEFGTITGNTAGFTTVTGTTVTGTTANFVTVSGTTVTGDTGQFTNITGVNIVGTTQVSGATVTGNIGLFTTITGGIHTLTSGVFASGTAANPSITFVDDLDTGLFTGSANTVSIGTNGGAVLTVSGTNVGIGTTSPTTKLHVQQAAVSSAPTRLAALYLENNANCELQFVGNSSNDCQLRFGTSSNSFKGALEYQLDVDALVSYTDGTEKARIDSSGRLLVGTSSARNNFFNSATAAQFQIEGTGANSFASITRNSNNTNCAVQIFAKSRGTTVGSNTVVTSGDQLGQISFQGSDGTEFVEAATITTEVDGTPDANDMPGRLVFSTTADGASTPTERMRINSLGRVGIGTTSPDDVLDVRSGAAGFSQFVHASGQGGIRIAGTGASSSANLVFSNNHTSGISDEFTIQMDGATDDLLFISGGTGGTERVRITEEGRLGVGSTAPARQLTVYNSTVPVFQLVNNTTGETANDGVLLYESGSNFVIENQEAGEIQIYNNGSQRATIDSSGRLLIGTSNRLLDNTNDLVQVLADGGGGIVFGRNDPSVFVGNGLGKISFAGRDATDSVYASFAEIIAAADGEHGAGDNPTRLTFSTTADGASSPTERARLDSSGRLLVGTTTSPTDSINILAKGPVGGGGGGGCVGIGYAGASGPGDGNTLGVLRFTANGDSTHAEIRARQDGSTWTDGSDQPSRLQISTTADGSSTPTSRFRIGSTGNTLFQNITNYVAPDSDNAVSNGASGRRWSEIWAANGTIQTSDERAKNEITDATLGADFIKALRPVSYKWIEGGKRHTGEYDEENDFVYESIPGKRTHWGFIAQEVKQIVDDAGVDFGGWVLTDKDDPDSEQALRYDQFIAPLTKALQEALAKIETLEAKVAALEAQ